MCSYALLVLNFCYKLTSNPRCEEAALSETLSVLSGLWTEYGAIAKAFLLGAMATGIPTGIALYRVISDRSILTYKTRSEALELIVECRKSAHKYKSDLEGVLERLLGPYGHAVMRRSEYLKYFRDIQSEIVNPYVHSVESLITELEAPNKPSLNKLREIKDKAFLLKSTNEVKLEQLPARMAEVGKLNPRRLT